MIKYDIAIEETQSLFLMLDLWKQMICGSSGCSFGLWETFMPDSWYFGIDLLWYFIIFWGNFNVIEKYKEYPTIYTEQQLSIFKITYKSNTTEVKK